MLLKLAVMQGLLTFKNKALVSLSLASASKTISGSLMEISTVICGGSWSVVLTVAAGLSLVAIA